MTERETTSGNEESLFVLGAVILRGRQRISRWVVMGGVLAAVWVLFRPASYSSTTSFVPQGGDAARSGLASLAGQFGVSLPTGNQSLSPDFYAKLVKSRAVLIRIVHDTLVVRELGGKKIALTDLFEAKGRDETSREESGLLLLREQINVVVTKTTGLVEVSVSTRWPSVSAEVAKALLDGINNFNLKLRQGQGGAERKFAESRLSLANGNLRSAEDNLQSFLTSNRQYSGSASLVFERDRLQREVVFLQQLVTTLAQSSEEARIREVRDTPVITIVDSPSVPSRPNSGSGIKIVILGMILSGALGVIVVWASRTMGRQAGEANPEIAEFRNLLADTIKDFVRPFRLFKRPIGS